MLYHQTFGSSHLNSGLIKNQKELKKRASFIFSEHNKCKN